MAYVEYDTENHLYGAAPPPEVPPNCVSLNPPNSSPPGRWLYPTKIQDEDGLAIRQYYYVKHKPSMAYQMNNKGQAKVAPLSKGTVDLKLDEAKILARELIKQLELFGHPRDTFLSPPSR